MLAVSQDPRAGRRLNPTSGGTAIISRFCWTRKTRSARAYSISGVPETFIIDRQGRIVAHHMGGFDWSRSDVRGALEELLHAKDV